MGIIARQSAKSSIVSLSSSLIGVLATLFIYTLDLDAYGFSQILLAASILLAPFASLGLSGTVIRFYPEYGKTEAGRASFLSFLLVGTSVGSFLLVVGYYFLGVPILRELSAPDNDFEFYITYAAPILWLTVLQLFAGIVETYTMNFHRITVQTLATALLPKFILPGIILLHLHYEWSYMQLSVALILMRVAVLVLLLLYLYRIGELRLTSRIGRVTRSAAFRRLMHYSAYGIIGAIGGKIALQIDTVSLGAYVTNEKVGVYQIIVFAASVITIPYYALTRISSPILTQAIEAGNFVEVKAIYQRSSLLLGFIGIVVFTGIAVSLEDIFVVTGQEAAFTGGLTAFMFVGLSKLFDLIGSVNGQIISFSHLYRYNPVLIVVLALMNIALNTYFIAYLEWGIVGAAAATMLSLGLFNGIKTAIIYFKLGIQPLLPELIWPVLMACVLIPLWNALVLDFHPVVNICIRSALTGAAFLAYGLGTAHLPEFKEYLRSFTARLSG